MSQIKIVEGRKEDTSNNQKFRWRHQKNSDNKVKNKNVKFYS